MLVATGKLVDGQPPLCVSASEAAYNIRCCSDRVLPGPTIEPRLINPAALTTTLTTTPTTTGTTLALLTCPGAAILSFASPLAATRLIGSLDHSISTQAGISVEACAALCIADGECASFEFKNGSATTNCKLKRVNGAGAGGTIDRDMVTLYERLLICPSTSPTAAEPFETTTPTPQFEIPSIQTQDGRSCTDSAGWEDAIERSCAVYATPDNELCNVDGAAGVGWASEWGSISNFASTVTGEDAFTACCACGGGQMAYPATPPLPFQRFSQLDAVSDGRCDKRVADQRAQTFSLGGGKY